MTNLKNIPTAKEILKNYISIRWDKLSHSELERITDVVLHNYVENMLTQGIDNLMNELCYQEEKDIISGSLPNLDYTEQHEIIEYITRLRQDEEINI